MIRIVLFIRLIYNKNVIIIHKNTNKNVRIYLWND